MLNFKRPMLAASLLRSLIDHTDENILAAMQKLRYPVLATLKMDGIRAIKLNQLVSRRLKPIPNKSIQARAMKLPAGFDMELFNPDLQYDEIESIVMSREHPRSDLIQFHVLDIIHPYLNIFYIERLGVCRNFVETNKYDDVKFQDPFPLVTPESLLAYFKQCESQHGEGICFRTPNSPYKQGRSTLKEQYLVKLSRYLTGEATVLGFNEQMENGNPATTNALGYTEHSSHGDMQMGKDTLGSLHVKDLKTDIEFDIGTGFTDKLRQTIWNNPATYINSIAKYKYKPHGQKDKPRHPVFVGWRNRIDL